MSESRVFMFRSRMLSPFWTIVWVLITLYLLWRIGQAITGTLPPWIIRRAGTDLRNVDLRNVWR